MLCFIPCHMNHDVTPSLLLAIHVPTFRYMSTVAGVNHTASINTKACQEHCS